MESFPAGKESQDRVQLFLLWTQASNWMHKYIYDVFFTVLCQVIRVLASNSAVTGSVLKRSWAAEWFCGGFRSQNLLIINSDIPGGEKHFSGWWVTPVQHPKNRARKRNPCPKERMGQLRLPALLHPTENNFYPKYFGRGNKIRCEGDKTTQPPRDGMAEVLRARNTHWGDPIEEKEEEDDEGTALGEEGRGRGDHRHQDGHDKNQADVEQHPGQPRERKTRIMNEPPATPTANPPLFNIPKAKHTIKSK